MYVNIPLLYVFRELLPISEIKQIPEHNQTTNSDVNNQVICSTYFLIN